MRILLLALLPGRGPTAGGGGLHTSHALPHAYGSQIEQVAVIVGIL